jgi:hypothetical protein
MAYCRDELRNVPASAYTHPNYFFWSGRSKRKSSISIPSFSPARPKSPQLQGTWSRATIAKLVGTTQLTVSGNQGQPYLSGSK